MAKYFFNFFLILIFCSTTYASGGITHMFLAKETIAYLPNSELKQLLQNNLDDYLVGSYYPDSGYILGARYGEDSHWDSFILTFADYIKDNYSDPLRENPKLVAFLFGCATHRLSDAIIHNTFYGISAKHDFNNVWSTAHTYGDLGIDLLILVDKNQWNETPIKWWIPVKDLVAVYNRMGKKDYTAKEIIWGNSILYLASYGEKLIASPAYLYLKWRMPWTAEHYYDWPVGGLIMNERATAEYLLNLWEYLQGPPLKKKYTSQQNEQSQVIHDDKTALGEFSKALVQSGTVSMPVAVNEDGSVEIQTPVINSHIQFQKYLFALINNIKKG